ncbi:hypothetical protein THAOC_30609, partial [Thalassiosira oceanica]
KGARGARAMDDASDGGDDGMDYVVGLGDRSPETQRDEILWRSAKQPRGGVELVPRLDNVGFLWIGEAATADRHGGTASGSSDGFEERRVLPESSQSIGRQYLTRSPARRSSHSHPHRIYLAITRPYPGDISYTGCQTEPT